MSVSHEEVVKAAQAEQILTSEVFKEAVENLKNEYITHWLNSREIDDVTAREDIHRSLQKKASLQKLTSTRLEKSAKSSLFTHYCYKILLNTLRSIYYGNNG
jgi:hypothetical protein